VARPATAAQSPRRSYDQYCPVARALDVLGERWTLLVVRDLLMGPKRYTDLRDGLPGIASDLLTARLRTLESAGFVTRRELPRPAPATVYELTDAGRRPASAILALGRVGLGLLGEPTSTDDVRPEPLALSLRLAFRPEAASNLEETYNLVIDGEPFNVAVANATGDVHPGAAPDAALSLTCAGRTLVSLLRAETTADEALADNDVELSGDRSALDRFLAAFAYPTAAMQESK
jgi:DNA-binding HxlR family transcriptional regulator